MYAWLQRYLSFRNGGATAAGYRPAVATPAPAVVESPAPVMTGTLSLHRRDEVNALYFQWLFERPAYPNRELNVIERDILGALDELMQASEPVDLVLRMPGVIPHLMRSIRADNFSAAQLSQEISQDVSLVAEVIRLVNSSLYNPATTITSVEHAVLVLGQVGLRHLVTCMAFRPIIDVNSGYFVKLAAPRVWRQAEACALANRLLAADQSVDPFHAFLLGLAQNVGLIVCLRVMDQVAAGKQVLGSALFLDTLVADAGRLSSSVARQWGFPEAVSHAIEEQGHESGLVANSMSPMGKTLYLGDHLSKLKLLVQEHRIDERTYDFTTELSPVAVACYQALGDLHES